MLNLQKLTQALSGAEVPEESQFAVQMIGTLLAGVPPGLADSGATQILGADHPLQLVSAQAAPDICVARPRASVWDRKGHSVIGAKTSQCVTIMVTYL